MIEMRDCKISRQKIGFIALACTIGLSDSGFALTPINSVQDGRIINGGSYNNTADSKTTFMNSGPGGLWLKTGSTVRGLEVDTSGALTNKGGTIQLYAPGQVVRVDGNINVNANTNGQGASLGNGGNVFINSAYLFQNGNITANGINGGLVQANVGSMTLGSGASIQAKGLGGAGGVVALNASGPVDLRRGSVIDTSGRVIGSFDTNLINIEGSLVNNDATLRADGIAAQFGGSRGGTIRLVASGQSDLQDIKNVLQTGTQNPVGDNTAPTISTSERTFILQRTSGLINSHEGDVVLNRDTQNPTNPSYVSLVSANATGGQADAHNDYSQNSSSRSGDGGTVMLTAVHNVVNQGRILANGANGQSTSLNGGNGGTISVLAQNNIVNDHGRLETNGGAGTKSTVTGGNGGNGGLMAFGYNGTLTNTGGLYADGGIGGSASTAGKGGNGGLIVFSGDANPTGNGSIDVIARAGGNNNLLLGGKSGTIVTPTPGTLGSGQAYFQQGYVNGQLVSNPATQQTQPTELLTHAENLILMTKNSASPVSENLFSRLLQASIRSVEDPTGTLGQARTEVINKNTASSPYVFRNLTIGSSRNNQTLDMTHPYHYTGGFGPGELIFPSPLSMGEGFSTINTLNVVNDGSISTQVLPGEYDDSSYQPTNFWLIGRNNNSLGGGRLSMFANGNLDNFNVLGTTGVASGGSVNIAALNTIDNSAALTAESPLHGGSIILKAGNNIINDETIYYSIGTMSANGGLMGGTLQIRPLHDFDYRSGVFLTAITSDGGLQGGDIGIRAGHNSVVSSSDFGGGLNRISANGISSTQGRGGYISIHAGNSSIHDAPITATGGSKNGTIVFTVGNN